MLWDDGGLRWSSLLWFLLSNFCERSRPLQATLVYFDMSWQSCFPPLPSQDFPSHCHIQRNHDHISLYSPASWQPQSLFVAHHSSKSSKSNMPPSSSTKTVAGKRRREETTKRRKNDVLGRQSCIGIWTFSKTPQQKWEWFFWWSVSTVGVSL